jgi:hypothetical protein
MSVEKNKVEPKKMNASQKIDALEQMILTHNAKFEILAEEIDVANNKIISLAKRLNATIKAGEQGDISGDSINKMMVEENIKVLEMKVQHLIDNGILLKNDDAEIADDVFFVGRELDEEGAVLNPRIQWAAQTVDESLKKLCYGLKTGDIAKNEESNTSLEILEVYKIVDPMAQKESNKEVKPANKKANKKVEAQESSAE